MSPRRVVKRRTAIAAAVTTAFTATATPIAPSEIRSEAIPALAIRVLTDPRGRVQTGIVAFVEAMLRRDMAENGLVPLIEPDALAYALVRLGESFLYADVLAARQPDVATADRLQQALVEGIRTDPH